MMVSCLGKEADMPERRVSMKISVPQVSVISKAAVSANPFLGSDLSENALWAELWFSLQPGEYAVATPSNSDTYIPCHTEVIFSTNDITPILYNGNETQALKYPTNEDYIYCVGLYPQEVWRWDNQHKFVAPITGRDDLMFASEIKGRWDAQLKSQCFSHMLTWIKVVVCATSNEAAQIWGDISSISTSTAEEIRISEADGTGISYIGAQNLSMIDTPVPLSINHRETGSVFCAPSSDITLKVTTSKGLSASKRLTIAGGFLAGKQYVIVLYFNELSIIEGMCSLNSWENQNDNLYLN